MTNSQGQGAWGVGGVRLVAFISAYASASLSGPCLSLNASHTALNAALAQLYSNQIA